MPTASSCSRPPISAGISPATTSRACAVASHSGELEAPPPYDDPRAEVLRQRGGLEHEQRLLDQLAQTGGPSRQSPRPTRRSRTGTLVSKTRAGGGAAIRTFCSGWTGRACWAGGCRCDCRDRRLTRGPSATSNRRTVRARQSAPPDVDGGCRPAGQALKSAHRRATPAPAGPHRETAGQAREAVQQPGGKPHVSLGNGAARCPPAARDRLLAAVPGSGSAQPTQGFCSPTQGFCGFRAPDERGQRPPDPDFRRGLADRLQRPLRR